MASQLVSESSSLQPVDCASYRAQHRVGERDLLSVLVIGRFEAEVVISHANVPARWRSPQP